MKRRKRKYWKPVVTGFAVLYLVTMILATYLVKEKFADEYRNEVTQFASTVIGKVADQKSAMEEEGWDLQKRRDFYQELANEFLWMIDSEFLSVSAAFYDEEKNMLAKSRNEIGQSYWTSGMDGTIEKWYNYFGLDDYLSLEELKELAGYVQKGIQTVLEANGMVPDPYRFSIRLSPDQQELLGIFVQEVTWEERTGEDEASSIDPLTGVGYSVTISGGIDFTTGGKFIGGMEKEFQEKNSRIVWEWKNAALETGQEDAGKVREANIKFPYLTFYYQSSDAYQRWDKWNSSKYLQSFPQQEEFTWEPGIEEPPFEVEKDGLIYRGRYRLIIGFIGDPFGYAEIRMEARPWQAAMDYMKYIYLAGFVLTLACMAKVIYVFRQTNKKQAELEETRRDFINAMAHELKTPLGIIRNFAENLMEHNMEEKRDYYLTQIIGQTEEIDSLVTEMIGISKLDSDKLELKKETISFSELVREQMERFQPMIREKNLQIRYKEKADFLAEGDREYLARAVWNLLSNAVDYNIPGGSILVRTEGERCVIENTGFPMGEDQLLHAFDLFYTEDQSRSGRDRHMGMGLFLAKKILDLHGIKLTLESTSDGVRAVVSRG